ncbi:MAG TPA: ABC transporter substrate-binding protein [Steroidobacteraceae bacterium]|nr:ABC transporter substrate-binding protein [Steroidobacteraceae bacterium]
MPFLPNRRVVLRGVVGASALLPVGAFAQHVFLQGTKQAVLDPAICRASFGEEVVLPQKRVLNFAWNGTSICTVGVAVAKEKGFFAKRNLAPEFINWGGSTDQLLEAISTAKADAGVGMALRWLKALESGFDVKIVSGIHGGCMRLLTAAKSPIHSLNDLKGKTIGTTDNASPDRNFFSIMLHQAGLDPNNDVEWKVFPGDILPVALKKGEVHAFAQGDPLAWSVRERDNLFEIANNLSGEYARRTCCVLGIRGELVRKERPVAIALAQALLEAQEWVVSNPDEAAEIFAPYSPKVPVKQLAAIVRDHTHSNHPTANALREQITLYADELKQVGVFKKSTDIQKFAARVTSDLST